MTSSTANPVRSIRNAVLDKSIIAFELESKNDVCDRHVKLVMKKTLSLKVTVKVDRRDGRLLRSITLEAGSDSPCSGTLNHPYNTIRGQPSPVQ